MIKKNTSKNSIWLFQGLIDVSILTFHISHTYNWALCLGLEHYSCLPLSRVIFSYRYASYKHILPNWKQKKNRYKQQTNSVNNWQMNFCINKIDWNESEWWFKTFKNLIRSFSTELLSLFELKNGCHQGMRIIFELETLRKNKLKGV